MIIIQQLLFFSLLTSIPVFCNAYKILFLVPLPLRSHWHLMENIINGLLDRGHEITAITSFDLNRDLNSIHNYTDIRINPIMDMNNFGKFIDF